MQDTKKVIKKINQMLPFLNESQKRLYLASEAICLGRGGKSLIEREIGVSHNTINKGIEELSGRETTALSSGKQRKKGGGRKSKITNEIWNKIKTFIKPHTRGEPESPLLWVSKSLRNIEEALKDEGIYVSHRIIGDILKRNKFSLQANRKTYEGKTHPDRDAQFEYINKKVNCYHKDNQPVISVDAKKRELIGNFKNTGKEWHEKSSPLPVNAYDFLTDAEGIAIPYGILDQSNNKAWVNVGITKDTAEFAVQSIRNSDLTKMSIFRKTITN